MGVVLGWVLACHAGASGARMASIRPLHGRVLVGFGGKCVGVELVVGQAAALHEVALRNMDQQRQRQLQADSFFRIGTKPEIDVLIAKTAISQAELQLTQARNNILLARTQLVQALGVPEEEWQQWLTRSIAVDEHAPPSLEQIGCGH